MQDALPFAVLYEDNHLLAVNKPAGLATMGVASSQSSLLTEAKQYIKRKYDKPGNVYLGIVSRLDAPVTGVVLLARTSKAAARLSEQFRGQDVLKQYWVVVEEVPDPPAGECVDWLRKDERHRRMHVAASRHPDAKEARLRYRLLKALKQRAWLEITLETGRKHQIRLQLANRGWPIVGDRKYGARTTFEPGIGLHARLLRLEHPVQRTPLEITAPVPASWAKWGIKN